MSINYSVRVQSRVLKLQFDIQVWKYRHLVGDNRLTQTGENSQVPKIMTNSVFN